jgi:diguanylate cyclase (GGDEF)-like protein
LAAIHQILFRFKHAILLTAGILVGGVLLLWLTPPGRPQQMLANSLNPLVDLLSVAALILAARASSRVSSRLGWVWSTFALSVACLAAGDITWGILSIGFNKPPETTAVNVIYFAAYPLFLVGALMIPSRRLTTIEWMRRFLDIAIVMLAAGLIFWNYLIGVVASSPLSSEQVVPFLALAYPIGDLVIIWVVVFLIYRQDICSNPRPLMLLGAGGLVLSATHIIYSYQMLLQIYQGGSILDIGWTLATLLAGLAGVLQWETVSTNPGEQETVPSRHNQRFRLSIWMSFFPYVWIVLAYLLLIAGYRSDFPMSFLGVSIGVGCVITLVLVRQAVVLYDNERLNTELNHAIDRLGNQTLQLKAEISERLHAEERLLYDATHDDLTSLPNRVLFMDRLERAIAYNQDRPDYAFSVLFLDVDQFKVINDSLGHTFGDKVLITIASRLKTCLRTGDTIARLGGDEFVVLLEGSPNLEAVIATTHRIQNEIRNPMTLEGHQVYTSASVGIVSEISGYEQPEDVLRDADIAMYRAKALGKDRYEIFDPRLRAQAISRLEMESDLRKALEGDQFFLYYQPIMALGADQAVGFETLLRWRHPKRGMISPADFIPIAEETGLIIPLGKWVLQNACKQIIHWQESFPGASSLSISVNISGKQFIQPDFVSLIEQILKETHLNPPNLVLEITETVFINHAETASQIFTQLCDLGIQLQIDDFGTGYSSLGYLQHFPIHTIKIDQSFIRGMATSNKAAELVHTILVMAHDLGMEAIAEGIETTSELDKLIRFGCRFGQGYLFSRPMDQAAAERWLASKIVTQSGPSRESTD